MTTEPVRLDSGSTLQPVTDLVLFDMKPTHSEVSGLSVGRRRTLRQHALVEMGVHPLARRPTRPELGSCGDCAFRQVLHGGNRSYPKCTFDPARVNHSVNTDCRAWWPACPDHKTKDS